MEEKRQPRRYDHVGAWFMTPQASKWGLAFTIIFGLLTAAEYAKRYTITTRERMGCTWHLLTEKR